MTSLSSSLRELVRQRAHGCCEYCGKPEIHSSFPFHVDHIHSLKHSGSSEPDNLAWSCFQCNTAKGPNIASIDAATGQLTLLFHPRQQRWSDHFRFEGGQIVGLTAEGRVTVQVLRMNEPEEAELRERHIRKGRWGSTPSGTNS